MGSPFLVVVYWLGIDLPNCKGSSVFLTRCLSLMGPYCYGNTTIAAIHVQISFHLPKVEIYAES